MCGHDLELQLQRTADQDTRTAYANFTSSISQVVVLREAALLAAKNFEAQVDDYRKGVVSNLDVLTALQDYQSARQQLHNSNMQARLNLLFPGKYPDVPQGGTVWVFAVK